MRICILTHGGNNFARHYAKAFTDRGHDVTLYLVVDGPLDTSGFRTRVFGPPGYDPGVETSRTPYLKTILPIRRAVRRLQPDVLFALYLSSAGLIACLTGHPNVVVSARGSDVNSHVDSRLWRAILRWEGRKARLVHAVSQPLADKLRDRVGVDPAKLLACPIGVDTASLPLIDPGARPDNGRIISTRSHRPIYDQATLIRALVRLRQRGVDCHVTFANTEAVERTERLVREHDLAESVTFLPGYRLEELPSLLADADVYVSCSLSDGTSSSLLETLATGTFPIVSDIEANRPWVEHGRNGYLFPVGDDAALADRLAEALSRPDVRAAAAPVSREIVVDRGDVTRQMDRLLAAFEALSAGGAPDKPSAGE